jgi:hypothetical protein
MGLAKAYEAWQRIGVFFGALGAMTGGVVLWVGPEDIPKEVPAHREIGLAIGALGVVILLAVVLGTRTGVGRRFRSLTLAGIAAVVVFLAGRKAVEVADGALRLADQGVAATAVVTSTTFVAQNKGLSPRVRIAFDGHAASRSPTTRAGWPAPRPGSTAALLSPCSARSRRSSA